MVGGGGLAGPGHLLRHHVRAPDGPLRVVPAHVRTPDRPLRVVSAHDEARLGGPRRGRRVARHGGGLPRHLLLVQQLLGSLRSHHVQGSLGLSFVETGRFRQ